MPLDQFSIYLPEDQATSALGIRLGQGFNSAGIFPAVFFRGDLGAGKTTMIRGIVSALPGGEEAEVSSPSFNLVNIYPTTPETAHVDLYRLEGQDPDEEVIELLQDPDRLVVVEWSENLSLGLMPRDRVVIVLDFSGDARMARVSFFGAGTVLEKFINGLV